MKLTLLTMVYLMIFSCAAKTDFKNTVKYIDKDRFMTKWYVIAGRLTLFEEGAHNAVEYYKWNKEEERVDIEFTMRKGSFDGPLKSIKQKGWIENQKTNAYWKVSPMWPFKFDYLVIDLAKDYSWTVIGVPNQKWVWIFAKDWNMDDEKLKMIISRIDGMGYSIAGINRVPQKW